jgi:hypothetical protein
MPSLPFMGPFQSPGDTSTTVFNWPVASGILPAGSEISQGQAEDGRRQPQTVSIPLPGGGAATVTAIFSGRLCVPWVLRKVQGQLKRVPSCRSSQRNVVIK